MKDAPRPFWVLGWRCSSDREVRNLLALELRVANAIGVPYHCDDIAVVTFANRHDAAKVAAEMMRRRSEIQVRVYGSEEDSPPPFTPVLTP